MPNSYSVSYGDDDLICRHGFWNCRECLDQSRDDGALTMIDDDNDRVYIFDFNTMTWSLLEQPTERISGMIVLDFHHRNSAKLFHKEFPRGREQFDEWLQLYDIGEWTLFDRTINDKNETVKKVIAKGNGKHVTEQVSA